MPPPSDTARPLDDSALAAPTSKYSARNKATILVFATLATLLDGVDLAILFYFLVPVSKHFGVSLASVSVVVGCAQIAGVAGAIGLGHISDRYGRKPALALSVAMYSIFTLISGLSTTYGIFFVSRILVGFGLGGEVGIAYALVNETLSGANSRRGLASALLQSMFTVGAVIAATFYSLATNAYGVQAWRWVFGYLGLAVFIALAIIVFMPESEVWLQYRGSSRSATAQAPPLFRMFRRGLALKVIVATLMLTFAWAAIYVPGTYAPTIWQTVYRLSPAQVGLIGSVSSIMLGLGYLLAGSLSDLYGRRKTFSQFAWLSAITYALFVVAASGYFVAKGSEVEKLWVVVAFCFAHASCCFLGIQGSWISEILPIDVRTSAFNFVYYVSRAVGGGLLPVVVLLATQKAGLGLEFVVAFGIIGAAGAALLARFLPEVAVKARIANEDRASLTATNAP